mmetsp:Transcript_3565/g.8993  ORF Transcript_3565/g.8993 Transcript_3565/m.8993 type:complete len:298 (-) Transcript_3565:40-933(-)
MLIFVGITIYFLVIDGRHPDAVTRAEPNMKVIRASINMDDWEDGKAPPILGIDVLITAYYYQLIILEIIAEMKHPSQFPKANYWSTPVVLFVALSSAVFQYYYQGEDDALSDSSVQEVLASIFDYLTKGRNALAYIGVICFSIHMIGCCVIRSVVLTRSTHLLIDPKGANEDSWRSRLAWAGISIVILLMAWTLTLFIRFLGLMALLNGFLALITSIVLPVVLYILCCRKRKILKRVPKLEWALLVFILLLSLATVVIYFVKLGERLSDKGTAEQFSNRTFTEIDTMMTCSNFHNMY